jgi:hypothetical protein
VVIAGESHIKGSEASEAGVALLHAFPVRGLEGVALHKTMCDLVLNTVMTPYFSLVEAAGSSTISKAKEVDALDAYGNTVPTTNLRLEIEGTPSTWLGEASKILIATPFISAYLDLAAKVVSLIPTYGEFLQRGMTTTSYVLSCPFQAALAGLFFSVLIPERWCKISAVATSRRILGVMAEWIINERNERMTKTLLEHAEGPEYHSPVLVVVGATHLRGIGRLLEKEGWNRVHPPTD